MSERLTYIIIDDELHCRGAIKIFMQNEFPDFTLLAECEDGLVGMQQISHLCPDFIFLDISMPKMNGFEMLEKISDPNFEIIFTTAFDNFAIKAFKVSAIDYLLKPVDKIELKTAVLKVKNKSSDKKDDSRHATNQLSLFLENVKSANNHFPNIALPTLTGLEMVKVSDILHVESDSNYSIFHFIDGKKKTVTKTLKEIEKQLKFYAFSRIHRSNLINLLHLKEYVKGEGGYVILNNGQHLDVSRRKKDALITQLRNISHH